MSATDVVEHERPTPPSQSPSPAEREAISDEIARLEERRRDAYRVG